MKNLSLAIFDIDGTLVPYGIKQVPTNTQLALQRLKAKGVSILIATGRTYPFIQPRIIESVPCDYLVTINGACLNRRDGSVLHQVPFDQQAMDALTRLCVEEDFTMGYKYNDHIVCYNHWEDFKTRYVTNPDATYLLVDATQTRDYHMTHGPALGCFVFGDPQRIEAKKDTVPYFRFARAGVPSSFDVISNHVSKASMVNQLLKDHGWTWDNTIAFGDALNDCEMIEQARIGVAMGNGHEGLKEKADYVTADCAEDGITLALEHFQLI